MITTHYIYKKVDDHWCFVDRRESCSVEDCIDFIESRLVYTHLKLHWAMVDVDVGILWPEHERIHCGEMVKLCPIYHDIPATEEIMAARLKL